MVSEKRPECNIDDLMCQMQALGHLKSLKEILGEEKFQSSFPELEGVAETLSEKIQNEETSLKETLERCGLGGIETPQEEIKAKEE